MKLSAAIMAHPRRRVEAESLQNALDRPVPIIYDTVREPSKDPAQRWATGRRAWEKYDPAADWHMVIQDDALVCDDLIAGLEVALNELGKEGLMSPYTGTGRPDQKNVTRALQHADDKGHAWMSTRSLNWGVAICAPTWTIEPMLEWCSRDAVARSNYDWRIGVYFRDVLGWRTWYTVPSLVDHRDEESLVGHGTLKRKAHRFHDGSALHVNWARTPPNFSVVHD